MRHLLAAALCLLTALGAEAQTFTWTGHEPVRDFQTDTIRIDVSGLPAMIDHDFGLAGVCFSINHTYKSNLVISLISPDGHQVTLVEGQGGGSDNFVNTCVGMDGVPFALGAPPFSGNFLPVGDVSSLNNGQNPNGSWLFLVHDLNSPDTGAVLSASLSFTSNPPGSHGVGMGSNEGPAGPFYKSGLQCPGGTSGCDLLPDMTSSYQEIQTGWRETPGLLYVSNATPNIGWGPLEIYATDSCFCNGVPSPCNVPCPNGAELQHLIRQRIYRKLPGTDSLGYFDLNAGAMTFHPAHNHLHVDNWADYTLRVATSDPNPRNWPIVGTSVKQSYCLVNLGSCSGSPGKCRDNNGNTILTVPNNGFGFYTGCGLNQGIYPGYLDVYSQSLNQPIALDNVCNGNYYLVSITDPLNIFLESDETNNVVAVPITLTQQHQAPVIYANGSAQLCPGDSIVLTAGIASNYRWSTGDTSNAIIVRSPGTYTVSTSCGTQVSTSAPFTVTALDPQAKPAVSITLTGGTNPACPGSLLTFKATPTYGGLSPAYQWKLNGVNAGTNSANFSMPVNAQARISCVMTSSVSCLSAIPAPSDTITIEVNPVDSFTALITQTKGHNPFCDGDTLIFAATARGGVNAVYDWKLNGVSTGIVSPTFISSQLTHGQEISCAITATAGCGSSATVGTGNLLSQPGTVVGSAYPSFYGNGRQQYLIRAAELQAAGLSAGNLNEIAFITGATTGDPATLNGYTIKLAQVPNQVMTTAMLNPAFSTVFGPVNYAPTLNSINRHAFSSPFTWDGTSSLLVDICFSNQVVGRASYPTYNAPAGFNATTYYRADGASGAGACSMNTGLVSTTRPVMLLANSSPKLNRSNVITAERIEPLYRFTGNGNWDNPANWVNGHVPPLHLLHCSEIIIDPVAGGECLLNVNQLIVPGAKITVAPGKSFRIPGSLEIIR